ncbi:hypothetical protein HALLA_09595 [Halostagnicola larsenii XH-48]|uniref:Uncharacterized protein n=1 Tax=Halostagnicola larsenii XH-48 TaxID=797299 RepID=W0JPY2_9EURY|nr:hypothetical protein [Halostagnicola larsenii]AHF99057.1 hypothetical protein HALLA_09430 [Halostagnicola larsenii XH-48]AHF99070.1 hypothetical protein HALLA_09595 [Halostagnicola larsenii XH-48]
MEAVELISSLGFPIAAFLLLFRQYQEERDDRREERQKWLESIQEHTAVLRSLRHDIQDVATDGGQDNNE